MPVNTGKRGRPTGLSKSGGRQLGTPNKGTLEVREKLENLGCDPIVGLVQIANDTDATPSTRLHAYAILMTYRYPKLGAAVGGESPAEQVEISREEALEIAKELLQILKSSDPQAQAESTSENKARCAQTACESDTLAETTEC